MKPTLCPYCTSIDTTYKAKAGKWECNACEERFDAPAPQVSSMAETCDIAAKATQPRRIFFSYGHDANREIVNRFKADLEKRGHQVWIDYKVIGSYDRGGAITRGIHDSQLAVAFLSINAARDLGECRSEIAMARHHFGTIHPTTDESAPMECIPAIISHLQWRELSEAPDAQAYERFYEEKLLEIIRRVEGEAPRFASESEVLRRVLQPSDFDSKFAQHSEGFIGREWCFEAFESWLHHQPDSRVFWAKAGPGFGKSALAVQIASRFRGAVAGVWFCDYQSRELSDPLQAVRTLAFQLALRWDDYRARLLPRLELHAGSREEQVRAAMEKLAKKNLKDLFDLLLAGPLAGMIWREHKLVILMDALDEVSSEAEGRNDLAAMIGREFLELPKWISFVVTSRPDALVGVHLQRFKPFEIAAEDTRNTADLRRYVQERVMIQEQLRRLPAEEQERLAEVLVDKSAGMVLYLRMVEEGLRESTLEAGQLDTMESGLAGLYSRYYQSFERRYGASGYPNTVQPLLRLMMAAPGPLPLDLAAEVLGIGKEESLHMRTLLGSYLMDGPAGLRLFHKTLGEWLGSEVAGLFYTDAAPAAQALGERLWMCFEERKKNAHGRTEPLRWEAQVRESLPKLLGAIGRDEDADALMEMGDFAVERVEWDAAEVFYRECLRLLEKAKENQFQSLIAENGLHFDLSFSPGMLERNGDEVCEILIRQRDILDGSELLLRLFEETEAKNNLMDVISKFQIGKLFALSCANELKCRRLLASLLTKKEEYTVALKLLTEISDLTKKLFGPHSPNSINLCADIAAIHQQKGDLVKSEQMSRDVLLHRENTLGFFHPETLSSMHVLAHVLRDKKQLKEAEVLYRQALGGREKALGAEHPDTLRSVGGLGYLLMKKGDYAGAELLYRRALDGIEKVLGAEHPRVHEVHYNFACLECLSGNTKEAKRLIADLLRLHPEKKDQAIADPDFSAIKGFIEAL